MNLFIFYNILLFDDAVISLAMSVCVFVCVCVFVPVSACVYEMRVVWKRPEIKAVTKS